ncbi:MAG: hypothetical protein QM534_15515 [Sediminibacterium sp.]|nr:hypothetical protein [Sediminibacterium sp.]
MFKERPLLIATKHEKEKCMAPVLERELGVKCFVVSDLDTDALGTFTSEVERKDPPLTTLRNKCLMGMTKANCDLVIASEGSFGPHPSVYFAPANDEMVMLMDKKNDLEIIAREISMETNFNGIDITTEKELLDFAEKALFPSHGLIIRKSKDDFTGLVKGITTYDLLITTFSSLLADHGGAYVETDMRAMYNPTRMKVIEKVTQKLINTINVYCPSCQTPGFRVAEVIKGLPCGLCGFPTESTLSYIYQCVKCHFSKEEKYPHTKQEEDPMYCNICNP